MRLKKRDRARRRLLKIKVRLKSREDKKGEEAVICLIACFLTLVFYIVAGYV